MKNLKQNMAGMKSERILRRAFVNHQKILKLIDENQFINSFDTLGRVLKLNGIQQFSVLVPDKEENLNKSMSSRSSRSRMMCDDVEEVPQKINEKIVFYDTFTFRDYFEYAIARARKMVVCTLDQYNEMKKKKPEYFEVHEGEQKKKGPALANLF